MQIRIQKGDLISIAVAYALTWHAGQVDKIGQPYILHVLRVGTAGNTENERVLGFLHDIREDTNISTDVLKLAFPDEIIMALAAITREPGEAYQAYIERAAKNPIAHAVKINDLNDNLARILMIPNVEDMMYLQKRYKKALAYLRAERSFYAAAN